MEPFEVEMDVNRSSVAAARSLSPLSMEDRIATTNPMVAAIARSDSTSVAVSHGDSYVNTSSCSPGGTTAPRKRPSTSTTSASTPSIVSVQPGSACWATLTTTGRSVSTDTSIRSGRGRWTSSPTGSQSATQSSTAAGSVTNAV